MVVIWSEFFSLPKFQEDVSVLLVQLSCLLSCDLAPKGSITSSLKFDSVKFRPICYHLWRFQEDVMEQLAINSHNFFRANGFHKSRSPSSPYGPAHCCWLYADLYGEWPPLLTGLQSHRDPGVLAEDKLAHREEGGRGRVHPHPRHRTAQGPGITGRLILYTSQIWHFFISLNSFTLLCNTTPTTTRGFIVSDGKCAQVSGTANMSHK